MFRHALILALTWNS